MTLVQAADAVRLTGLTKHQLREWCGRRGVLEADVPPAGPGRHALYSWQSLLTLRLLDELHIRFATEVGAWKQGINSCRTIFQKHPFDGLWGGHVCFRNFREVALFFDTERRCVPGIALDLDPHLEILAAGLSALIPPAQLPLFPALRVQP